jgi:hypothetical protein
VFAFAAPGALRAAAVPAALPLEVPDLPALAATGPGAAFRAALRFAPAALVLVLAVPGAGARRAFRGAPALGAVTPVAPAVRARVAAAGLAAAFGAPARALPAAPWPPVFVAVTAAAPRRFGATSALLPPFAGAPAVRALPAGGFADALPRAGAPADALALFPTPGAARRAGLFPSSVGVFAIVSPRSFADAAPSHPRWLLEDGQACAQPVQGNVARTP